MKYLVWFLYFILISVIGYLVEVFIYYLQNKKMVNRGFLIGPYIPLYGISGLLLLGIDYYFSNPWLILLVLIIVYSIIKYITSYIIEKKFGIKFINYSNKRFNINGRISLFNSLLFSVFSVFLYKVSLYKYIGMLNNVWLIILSIIGITVLWTDFIISVFTFNEIRENLKKINNKLDNTEDIKELMKNYMQNKSILYRRINRAYSQVEYCQYEIKNRLIDYKDVKMHEIKDLRNDSFIIVCLFLGILCGVILSFFNKMIGNIMFYLFGIVIVIYLLIKLYRKIIKNEN